MDPENHIRMTGAWRIWCEHGGNDIQIQGNEFEPITTTNPPHVFEIHPITKINDINLMESLSPIDGYQYKNASDAFTKYENTSFRIIDNKNQGTVTIQTVGIGYNYAEFKIELLQDPEQAFKIDDGLMLMCKVLDLEDEILIQKLRMVFIKDSLPEQKVKSLKKGNILHVVGIPRIDLALISYRIDHAVDKPGILEWNLPYEMIVVAVFDEQ